MGGIGLAATHLKSYRQGMSASLEDIASDALQLPKDQRLTLAHRILASLEPGPDAGAEAAWDGEIRERIRKYDAGRTSVVPGSTVFEELDKKLKK
jgi:putative addiction module component (TIGR02574 family)